MTNFKKSGTGFWGRSIKAKTGAALFVIIIGVLGLFGVLQYLASESVKTKDLEDLSNRTISRLAEQLVLPLWEVDNLWVRETIISEMRDKRIFAIAVTGEGNISEGMKRDTNWGLVNIENDIPDGYIFSNLDIFRNKRNIGSVSLWITKRFMISELRRNAWELASAVVVFSVFCIFFLSWMLHKIVIHPINRILITADAIANGEYDKKLILEQQDEIGILGRGFNSMQEKISQREIERDRSEIKLRESEQAFRSLAENSPDVIVRYDREGRYIYVNQKFENINRIKADQVYGKKPSELFAVTNEWVDVFTKNYWRQWTLAALQKSTCPGMRAES